MATHPDRRVSRTLWFTLVVATLFIASRAVLADIVEARHTGPGTMSTTGAGVSIPGSDAVQVDGSTMTRDTITGGIGADATRPIRATIPVSASFITTIPSNRPLRSPTPPVRATIPVSATIPATMSLRPIPRATPTPSDERVAYQDDFGVQRTTATIALAGNVLANDRVSWCPSGATRGIRVTQTSGSLWIGLEGALFVDPRWTGTPWLQYHLTCTYYDAASGSWWTDVSNSTSAHVEITDGPPSPRPSFPNS